MGLKICILIIIILLIILLRKYILKFIKILYNNCIIKKLYYLIKKFTYKLVEIFWIIMLGTIILLPLFIYYILKITKNISYNEYKELLEIVLNSNYVIIIGIIIIVYLFRNQLKRKIGQIKEVNTNGVKFEGTQFDKNREQKIDTVFPKDDRENYDTLEQNEQIYSKIKENIKESKNKIIENEDDKINRLEQKNYRLEEELKIRDEIIKREKFKNIISHMAKTTHIILIYIYNKYKVENIFKNSELLQILKDTFNKDMSKMEINLESKTIIQFLLNNKIIDTEDDETFSVTEFGEEFLNFLFKGGY